MTPLQRLAELCSEAAAMPRSEWRTLGTRLEKIERASAMEAGPCAQLLSSLSRGFLVQMHFACEQSDDELRGVARAFANLILNEIHVRGGGVKQPYGAR